MWLFVVGVVGMVGAVGVDGVLVVHVPRLLLLAGGVFLRKGVLGAARVRDDEAREERHVVAIARSGPVGAVVHAVLPLVMGGGVGLRLGLGG